MGDLDVPEARPEAGVDHVDVMDFLGLKKAESLTKKAEDDVGRHLHEHVPAALAAYPVDEGL